VKNSEQTQTDQEFFFRWVRVTFFGWVIGFVFVMLALIAGDLLVDIGGVASRMVSWMDISPLGIIMGTSIGFMQGRIMKQWLGKSNRWVWASVIGMGVTFVMSDLVTAVWGGIPLSIIAAIGGLLTGVLQRGFLLAHSKRANWWPLACIVGWTLAATMPDITFTGPGDAILNLAMILSGGVVLGVVTGGVMVWIRR